MNEPLREYFAVTPPGLERLCFQELVRLGLAPTEPVHGGVGFVGGVRELYLANLWLRTAARVLVRLGTVTAKDFPALYQRLVRLPWGRYIKPGTCCDVRAVSHRSRLSHTGRIAEVCREAIVRALGSASGPGAPPQGVLLRVDDDQVVVSVDSSGEHLHRRGYCQARTAAPLRENLAAAALLASGYDGSRPLIDMMTGSGSFVIEAGLIARQLPPGASRNFSFMSWPKYREQLWQQLLLEARQLERKEGIAPILGIDNNPRAVAAGQLNLQRAGLGSDVQIICQRLQQLQPKGAPGLLIGNPPYGARLGRNSELQGFYRELEHACGVTFAQWQCALLCPEEVVKKMKSLTLTPVLRVSHGGIRVALFVKDPAGGAESA